MLNFILSHGLEIVGGVSVILSGILSIALIVPGDQPDKFLQGAVDFLKALSRKP